MSNRKKADEPQQVSNKEEQILVELMESTLAVDGDVVELGCYRGDTSVLFERALEKYNRETGAAKRLWIYDSFEGLPAKTKEDASVAGDQFQAGELLVTKREVIEKFKRSGLFVPRIKKGFFENLDPVADIPEKICFGFLDGDLYGSIKTSLKLTDKNVSKGSILVIHDYNNPELPGVTKAVSEWLQNNRGKIVSFEKRETLAILKF